MTNATQTETTSTGLGKRSGWTIEQRGEYIYVLDGRRTHRFFEVPRSAKTFAEAAAMIAAWVFGAGEGKLRRREGGCKLPHPTYARWGWTRETRPVGEVSVRTDYYEIVW